MDDDVEVHESSNNLPVKVKDTIFDKAKLVEEVGVLSIKGYSVSDIVDLTSLDPRTIRDYTAQYKAYIEKTAEDDPYFLEKVQLNTQRALIEMDQLSKEAWETVEIATREGMVTARTGALKLALDIATKKAQLHQLMGTAKTDGEYIARMQKAETVNQIVSKVVRDVVAECPRCGPTARTMLNEAFALIGDDSFERKDKSPEDHPHVEDAEIVED